MPTKGTVWLVDDSALDTEASSRALANEHELRTFSDGNSFLEHLAAHEPPDVVIVDLLLPDLSGLELCRFMRAQPRTALVGVLVLTGDRTGSEAVVEALAAGANDYVTKPFTPIELAARVHALVRTSALRRRAEEAESALGLVLEQLPDALLALEENGAIAFANREAQRVFTRTHTTLLGENIATVLPRLGAINLTTATATELPRVRIGERWYSPAVRRLAHGAGRANMAVLLRDVTVEVAAIRDRDEFLAMLSHELRNPLAPLQSASLLIAESPDEPQVVGQAGRVIERQVGKMARLLDDLLEVSRVTRGRIELQRETIDLGAVLSHVLETHSAAIQSKSLALETFLADGPMKMSGDPLRLEQILGNLLDNAIKFTPARGTITLRTARENDELVVRIADTGSGIPPAQLDRIFEVFAQTERTLARSQGGLGVGLAMARALVELHHGSIAVTSAGEAQGSEFIVRLPALPISGTPTPKPPTVGSAPRQHLRILVVDDNRDAAELLAEYLKMQGHDTDVAFSGNDALTQAEAHVPDLIFLDIGLPELDGYELAERFRANPAFASCVLVALTGYSGKKHEERAVQAGFDGFVVKPFDLPEIRAALALRRN